VLATDPASGKSKARLVVATIVGAGSKNLLQITVDTDGERGSKTGVVIATDRHPFWTIDGIRSSWKDAVQLQPGMWLRTSAGTYVQITAIKAWTQHQQVHNLTVDTDHTYYVLAGATPVLVHNCGDGDNLYRGVWPEHPDYDAGLKGDATPTGWGKPGPKLTPEEHNAGMNGLSDHTSWTTSRELAERRAKDGVVLKIPRGAYPEVESPDYFNEAEVLIFGPVRGG
jgi:hypothetical protein